MHSTRPLRRALLGAVAAIAFAAAVPALGQPRPLDVPYVPTPDHIVEAMLRLANPAKDDFLVDLGCGDGRIVVTAAARYGVRGFGVDLNPERIKEARANARKAGVTDRVEFLEGDLFKTDFKKASVLTMYLLPAVNMRLRPPILDMKPGTRIVSHAFHMEDWKPDVSEQHEFRTVYFWIVPAKVGGKWAGTLDGVNVELVLEQKFQELSGSATVDGRPAKLASARISGETVELELAFADDRKRQIRARAEGGLLTGDGIRLDKR